MLLTIILVFFVCWGPKLVVNIMKRFELSMLHSETAFFVKVRPFKERFTLMQAVSQPKHI